MKGETLPAFIRHKTQWATPMSADDGHKVTVASHQENLIAQAHHFCSPQAPAIPDGPESSESAPTSRRRLNPQFAAWLMGWPEWWTHPGVTSCEPLATEFAHYRQRLQSSLSSIVCHVDE